MTIGIHKVTMTRFAPATSSIALSGKIHQLFVVNSYRNKLNEQMTEMSDSGPAYRDLEGGTRDLWIQMEHIVASITDDQDFHTLKNIVEQDQVMPNTFILGKKKGEVRVYLGNPGWSKDSFANFGFRFAGQLISEEI